MRKTFAVALVVFASTTTLAATKHYPTPQPFAHVTSTGDRYQASSDKVSIPASGFAFRFTVPALQVRRLYCSVGVSADRAMPVTINLLRPDGTVIATENDCFQGIPSVDCQMHLSCAWAASTAHDTPLVLLVEPRNGATTISAGVTAYDPHE